MKIEEGTKQGATTIIINKKTGGVISRLKWFDTETKEAEMYVMVNETKTSHHDKLVEKFGCKFPVDSRRVAVYDAGKTGADIFGNGDITLVTAIVTLRHAIAVDIRTYEEIK